MLEFSIKLVGPVAPHFSQFMGPTQKSGPSKKLAHSDSYTFSDTEYILKHARCQSQDSFVKIKQDGT